MSIVFVHIPKAAGTSVYETYKEQGMLRWGHNTRDAEFLTFPNRDLAKDASDPVSFTIVRNPWDRVLSAYNYLKQGGNCPEDAVEAEDYVLPYQGFQDFVEKGLEKAMQEQLHFLPQLYWIKQEDGTVAVDHVLKYESIATDLPKLLASLGLNPCTLKWENKSKHSPYQYYYNERSIEIVEHLYQEEIKAFDYDYSK